MAAVADEHPASPLLRLSGGSTVKRGAIALYASAGAGFTVILTKTLMAYPMLPFQPNDADWSYNWLITTIADYYGAALCLCGIAIASERELAHGLLWSAGFCLLGTPVCCAWVVSRLVRHGSLRMA